MARTLLEITNIAERALDILSRELPISAAYLFGSHVDGVPHEGSDIDLAIFTPKEARPKLDERARLQLQIQRNCALEVELHFFPAGALEQARPTNFYGYLLHHGKRLR